MIYFLCLMFIVYCLLFGVWCLVFGVWCYKKNLGAKLQKKNYVMKGK